jgi:hypothetical protein
LYLLLRAQPSARIPQKTPLASQSIGALSALPSNGSVRHNKLYFREYPRAYGEDFLLRGRQSEILLTGVRLKLLRQFLMIALGH